MERSVAVDQLPPTLTPPKRVLNDEPTGEGSLSAHSRVANLDLLRAVAIGSVLWFHCGNVWEGSLFNAISHWGRQGVTIFFALSGWLIGGLFWRERKSFGDVQIPRFMLRRLIRTIPPYLIALMTAWWGTRVATGQKIAFDWKYLVFLQNYAYSVLPYFKPSWSLCVEEHFYLIMPALLTAAAFIGRFGIHAVLLAACLVPPIVRIYFTKDIYEDIVTTHWWLEGLALGVWASYFRIHHPNRWPSLQFVAQILAVPAATYVVWNEYLTDDFKYRYGVTISAWACAIVLVAVAEAKPLPTATWRLTRWIAVWSYSLYLTHTQSLAIEHAFFGEKARLFHAPTWLHAVLLPLFLLGGGAAFYFCFEAPTIALRDRFVPRRPNSKKVPARLDPGI